MTILTRGQGPTDRPTDIATFRAAIAAKSEEFDGEYSSLQLPKDSWVCCHHKEQCSTQVDSNIHLLVVYKLGTGLQMGFDILSLNNADRFFHKRLNV